jgi:hypothetical protein
MKEGGRHPLVLKMNGDFLVNLNGEVPTIVERNGTISEKFGAEWTSVDKEGIVYSQGKPTGVKCQFLADCGTGTRYMIRTDNIEYFVTKTDSRKVLFKVDFTLDQNEDRVTLDVPNFPVVDVANGKMSMEMDRFILEFNEDKTAVFRCNDYEVVFANDSLRYKSEKVEVECTLDSLEVRTEGSRLCATFDDEVFEVPSKHTSVDVFRRACPRFFAVRSDLTLVEFMRKDHPILADARLKSARIPYTFGGWSKVVTAHWDDLERLPLIFVENDTLSAEEEERIFRGLEEAEANQGDTDMSIADTAKRSYLADVQVFGRTLESFLEKTHQAFIEETYPDDAMGEEVLVKAPPTTPAPKVLEMRLHKSEKNVFDLKPGEVLDYWSSHETDFVIGAPAGPKQEASRRLGQFTSDGMGVPIGFLSQLHKV